MIQFIWEVRVSGNNSIPADVILSAAEEAGLKAGTWRKKYSAGTIENSMIIKLKGLSWVAVNINGCIADVAVREITPAPELYHDDDMPTNIVTAKTGIIRRMEVYDGAAMVRVGDAVPEEALLVSAVIEDEYRHLTLKHARAKVFAETEYSIAVDFSLEQTLKRRTGQVIHHKALIFFGMKLPLRLN